MTLLLRHVFPLPSVSGYNLGAALNTGTPLVRRDSDLDLERPLGLRLCDGVRVRLEVDPAKLREAHPATRTPPPRLCVYACRTSHRLAPS